MKKVLAAVGIGAALTTGALAIAPAASATPAENTAFLQALVNDNWQVWDVSTMISQGMQACNDIATIPGWTGNSEMHWLYDNTGYTWNESVSLVTAAVYNICPEYLPGGWANPSRGYLGA